MHIVQGLLVALQHIDQVIDLIRTMPDTASCREALMMMVDPASNNTSSDNDKVDSVLQLGLSREQADAVLRLQLGQLTRLNQGKLQQKEDELVTQSTMLRTLLEDDNAVYQLMVDEFQEMDTKFGHDRKTRILQEDGQVNEMDLITNARSGKKCCDNCCIFFVWLLVSVHLLLCCLSFFPSNHNLSNSFSFLFSLCYSYCSDSKWIY
jgi:DNA gyrase subunit A